MPFLPLQTEERLKVLTADCSKVDHCKNPDSCNNDRLQFHLTKKPNENGKLSFPYQADKDNHYAIDTQEPDLLQCRVVVYSHGPEYTATVYDVTGAEKGKASQRLENVGDNFLVKGLPMDLAILLGESPGTQQQYGFNYGAASFWETQLLKFFYWDSDESGVSGQFDPDGKYCTNEVEGLQQVTECYFPCPEK